jgi:hypothetical protein
MFTTHTTRKLRGFAEQPNYALKRTVRDEISGAITQCGPHGRLA